MTGQAAGDFARARQRDSNRRAGEDVNTMVQETKKDLGSPLSRLNDAVQERDKIHLTTIARLQQRVSEELQANQVGCFIHDYGIQQMVK